MENVIFDTNAYRYLVADKNSDQIEKLVDKLKSKEQQRGIQCMISPIVARELLAHVADRSDPVFEKCMKAIKAMYLHCSDGDTYRQIASPEMQIAHSFFGAKIPKMEEANKALIQIAFHLATNPSMHARRKFQKNLNYIKKEVEASEHGFAITMFNFIHQLDPNASDWKVFQNDQKGRQNALEQIRSERTSINLAAGFIYIVFQLLQSSGIEVELDENRLFDMSQSFITIFPEYIALYKTVLENLINSEFNLFENSRSNFLWDIQLMLNVGNHTVGGNRLYFVTDDKAIFKAAIQENAQYTILTFDEYMDYVH